MQGRFDRLDEPFILKNHPTLNCSDDYAILSAKMREVLCRNY